MKFKVIEKIRNQFKKLAKNESSLANIVKKEKKTNKEYRKLLKQNTEPIWIPSVRSFLTIASVVLFFAILSHLQLQFLPKFLITSFDNNHYQNFIAIHSGIGAVLIGLAFFVAQSLIDKNDPDKGRVLLYKSYFFPLLTAEILIFLIFIWGDVNIFALFTVAILALFTIYFLGSTINILIKDYEMEKAKKKMFFEILKKHFVKILDNEITKRIGGNRLYKKGEAIEKETNGLIRITPFGAYDNDKYLPITSEKLGVVTNISFKELEKFINEIKKIAKKHKTNTFNFSTSETTQQDDPINKQETIVYILPQFLGHTRDTSNEIIQIKEDLFNEEDKDRDLVHLNKMASRIFTIQELPDIEKEARLEISKIKDRCLKAIKNQETGELGKIVDFYVDLTKEFFKYINLYGGGFSSDQAEKERTSFFERLKPIEWLSRDIREIFEKGMQSDDINVIREVAYLPIRLANEAIDHKDHLIFQEFIYFPQLLYSYAHDRKNTDEKISKFMFDKTWRYLKELSDYHLESKFKKNKCDEENFIGFAIHLLKVFQSLIKASFDKKDFENFQIFYSKASILFRHLSIHHFGEDTQEQVFAKINKKRQEMFFGVASWIFFIAESNKNDTNIKKYFDVCCNYIPSEIKTLTQTFIDAHDFDVEHFWGWSNWELEGKSEDGEFAHSIDILGKLEKVYAIQSLKILRSKTDKEIENIELPHSRDLAFLAEGTRDLLKILDNIKTNSNDWKFVLDDNAISKVDKFKELLEKAKKAQDEEDLQKKRDAMISEDKVKKFKKAVVKNFYESHGIRNVLNYYKLTEDKSSASYQGKLKKLGINTMFDKAPFFDESVKWHVHFVGDDNGFDFGRSLINGENIEIIKIIRDKLPVIEKDKFNEMLADNNLSDIFIISLNGATWKFFEEDEKSKNYIPKWQLQTKKKYPDEIAGIYKFEGKEIPVYEIYDGTKSNAILVLNKDYLGQIIQYSPIDKGESGECQQDIFYMDVGVFTDDSEYMTDFLKNTPDWLKEVEGQDNQKNYLKERVVIKIFERFEFKLTDVVKGFKLNTEEVDEEK